MTPKLAALIVWNIIENITKFLVDLKPPATDLYRVGYVLISIRFQEEIINLQPSCRELRLLKKALRTCVEIDNNLEHSDIEEIYDSILLQEPGLSFFQKMKTACTKLNIVNSLTEKDLAKLNFDLTNLVEEEPVNPQTKGADDKLKRVNRLISLINRILPIFQT